MYFFFFTIHASSPSPIRIMLLFIYLLFFISESLFFFKSMIKKIKQIKLKLDFFFFVNNPIHGSWNWKKKTRKFLNKSSHNRQSSVLFTISPTIDSSTTNNRCFHKQQQQPLPIGNNNNMLHDSKFLFVGWDGKIFKGFLSIWFWWGPGSGCN